MLMTAAEIQRAFVDDGSSQVDMHLLLKGRLSIIWESFLEETGMKDEGTTERQQINLLRFHRGHSRLLAGTRLAIDMFLAELPEKYL